MGIDQGEYIWSVGLRSELSLSDEWETPKEMYDFLCQKYNIFPVFDICANYSNTKCKELFFTESDNALEKEWCFSPIWCNPPHNDTGRFVVKAFGEWRKYNITIMMIIPANSMCTNYAEECIEGKAEYHPINRRWCKFLHNGEEKDHSRNGYFVVIWRKK